MAEEMLYFLEVVQALNTTLKVAFHWRVMVRSNTRSETKVALECDLKSGSKHLSGPAEAGKGPQWPSGVHSGVLQSG